MHFYGTVKLFCLTTNLLKEKNKLNTFKIKLLQKINVSRPHFARFRVV